MRVLIYKMTHTGDPDEFGRFGIKDCMGRIRARAYDAVIGIGGLGAEPRGHGIDGKLNWIGIGPHRQPGARGPIVTFDHFLCLDAADLPIADVAPGVACRMYDRRARSIIHVAQLGPDEVRDLLALATGAPASAALGTRLPRRVVCGGPKRAKPKCRPCR